MSHEIGLLTEIRDLLQVMAEPALAQRDAKFRDAIRRIVKGQKNRSAVLLMDGARTKATIVKETGIDSSNLSKMVKALTEERLMGPDEKHPKLLIKLPSNF